MPVDLLRRQHFRTTPSTWCGLQLAAETKHEIVKANDNNNMSQILLQLVYLVTTCTLISQALTLAMCPLARMPFWGCRASSGHHNLFSTGPRGQCFFFFLVLRMPPLFLLGIGKTRKATLIRTYFSLYIGLMYKSVQLHAWNHKSPPRKHLGHYMFLGGQWVFWGASGFSDSLAPRASGCLSPMSRPVSNACLIHLDRQWSFIWYLYTLYVSVWHPSSGYDCVYSHQLAGVDIDFLIFSNRCHATSVMTKFHHKIHQRSLFFNEVTHCRLFDLASHFGRGYMDNTRFTIVLPPLVYDNNFYHA